MSNDILVLTEATMNGWKPVIFLEEAQIPYELKHVDFNKGDQKSDWFKKLNPNGRIPAIIDRSKDDFVIFESGAVLWYLAEKYEKFLSSDFKKRYETMMIIDWAISGLSPAMGQVMYFHHIATAQGINDEFAIKRFTNESRRVLEVLDGMIGGDDYLVGNEYSIADMCCYPYARSYFWARVDVSGLKNLKRWFDTLDARPLTQKALTIPKAIPEFFGGGDPDAMDATIKKQFGGDVAKLK